jgi:uncharacterized membrane protein YeaQ/YmgE (transglycosylase-associated protein family)
VREEVATVVDGMNVETVVVSVIGAIIVVFVAHLVMGTGRRRGAT